MQSLMSLPSLGKMGRVAPEAPKDPFDQRFLRKWSPLINKLSRSYAIPRRMPAEDIAQELSMKLWDLTLRVDPIKKPDDFRRLAAAELRNMCIDLTRFHNAQKRMRSVGHGAACRYCGAVFNADRKMICYCPRCGQREDPQNPEHMAWIDIKVSDVSLGSSKRETIGTGDDSGVPEGTVQDVKAYTPDGPLLSREVYQAVRNRLPFFPERVLWDVYARPPRGLLDILEQEGLKLSMLHAPFRHVHRWIEAVHEKTITPKDLRACFPRIAVHLGIVLGVNPENVEALLPFQPRKKQKV
jgi:hypothetical protein